MCRCVTPRAPARSAACPLNTSRGAPPSVRCTSTCKNDTPWPPPSPGAWTHPPCAAKRAANASALSARPAQSLRSAGVNTRSSNVCWSSSSRPFTTATTSRPMPTITAAPSLRSSAQHAPPVHVENLARDVPGQLGAQKHDRPCAVLRTRHPAERDGPLDLPLPTSRFARIRDGGNLRIDPPRSDAVHVDPTGGELDRERLRKRDDRAFRGRVVGVERLAALSGRRRHEHDPPAVGQERNGGAAHVQHAVQVGAQRRIPLPVGHGRDGHVLRRPDAVIHDQELQPFEALDRLVHGPPRRPGPPKAPCRPAPQPRAPLPPGAVSRRPPPPAPIADGDARPRLRQHQGRRAPDPPTPTRDERALAFEGDHSPNALSTIAHTMCSTEIGRASCRERV